jgi:uncharacterized protein YdeI (YjbR/CyaY-like superfamily)
LAKSFLSPKVDEFPDVHPLTREQWRAWLAEHHDQLPGAWFVYFKKQTGKPRVSYDEAVEEALCFGWIDSLPRKLDEERSKLLFTPRKAKSVWSKLNKERIERLIAQGLMTTTGLAKIEAAQKDGSWNALNASDNLEVADDLAQAFRQNRTAEINFHAFSNSVKKAILQWLNSAKRAETRAARIKKLITMAAQNKRVNFDRE